MKITRKAQQIIISDTERDRSDFTITITRMPRGAGGHYWEASWFPHWILTCCWTCHVFGHHNPSVPDRVPLRRIFEAMNRQKNAHYLPPGARQAIRMIAEGYRRRDMEMHDLVEMIVIDGDTPDGSHPSSPKWDYVRVYHHRARLKWLRSMGLRSMEWATVTPGQRQRLLDQSINYLHSKGVTA